VREKYGGEDYASLSPQRSRREASALPDIVSSQVRSHTTARDCFERQPESTKSWNKSLQWDMIMAKGDRD
jgi:hypothetical protein